MEGSTDGLVGHHRIGTELPHERSAFGAIGCRPAMAGAAAGIPEAAPAIVGSQLAVTR